MWQSFCHIINKSPCMKKIILSAFLMFYLAGVMQAQSDNKNVDRKHYLNKISSKKEKKNRKQYGDNSTEASEPYLISSSSSHSAYNSTRANTFHYQIDDPVIRAMNERAMGKDVKMSRSGIFGEPKGAFGYANGHLSFSTSSSTSSGTITGSGAVGTGSTPGSMGANGTFIGANGKNPYAGPSIWGTGLTGKGINITDSTRRK